MEANWKVLLNSFSEYPIDSFGTVKERQCNKQLQKTWIILLQVHITYT